MGQSLSPRRSCLVRSLASFAHLAAPPPLSLDTRPSRAFYVKHEGNAVTACQLGSQCNGGITQCPHGAFQNIGGGATFTPCTVGTMCPVGGVSLPTIWPSGLVCSLSGRFQPIYLCPSGSLCLTGIFTLNSLTQLPLSQIPNIGQAGTYCMPGTSSQIVNTSDANAPRLCLDGVLCGTNTTSYKGISACRLSGWFPA